MTYNRKKITKKQKSRTAGFTVVELLVAVALFTSIVSVAMGAYIRILRGQQLMTELMAANDNVSLVMEQMAREMRTGVNFAVAGGVDSEITFENDASKCVKYFYETEAILRGETEGGGACETKFYGEGERLTSEAVRVNTLLFNWTKTAGRLGINFDRITIRISLENVSESFSKENKLQTTISARKYFE